MTAIDAIPPSGEHRRRRRTQKRAPGFRSWNKKDRPENMPPQETGDWSQHYFMLHNPVPTTVLPDDFGNWTPALVYVRVSSDEQADMYGPDVQRRKISDYCRRNQIRVVDEFFDAHSGDFPLSARPEGAALLKALKLQKASTIVCLCLDRLARSEADAHACWRSFQYSRIELHFAKRGKQEDDLQGRIQFSVEAMMASVEREMIRQRTTEGTIQKAREGKWVGSAVPYGYNREGRHKDTALVIDPVTAPIVRKIFDWYVLGDDQEPPLTLMAIARRLAEMKVPRPGARYDGDTSNCRWLVSTISSILRNSTYRGIYRHGERITLPKEYDAQPTEERRAIRREEDIIEVKLPTEVVIIPNTLWEAAREKLVENTIMKNRQRNGQVNYLLSGFLFCTHCGRRMHGWRRRRRATRNRPAYFDLYYWCHASWYYRGDPDLHCPASHKPARCNDVDDAVMAVLRQELAGDRLMQNIDRIRQRRQDDTSLTRDRAQALRDSIADEKKKLDRIIDQMARYDDEDIVAGYERKMHECQRRLKDFKSALAQAEATIDQLDLTDEQASIMYEMAAGVLQRLEGDPSSEQVRAIFSLLKVQISLDPLGELKTMTLRWSFGEEAVIKIGQPDEPKAAVDEGDEDHGGNGDTPHVSPDWRGNMMANSSPRRLSTESTMARAGSSW